MELTDIIESERILDSMINALLNKRYDLLGQILDGFDTYTRLFLNDVEENSQNPYNQNGTVKYILMDLPTTAENMKSLFQDVNYLYKEIRTGLKRIDNDEFYPRNAYEVMKHYYEPILEQIGLNAIKEFQSVVNSVRHYVHYGERAGLAEN